MSANELTRRAFMKAACLGAIGSALVGCAGVPRYLLQPEAAAETVSVPISAFGDDEHLVLVPPNGRKTFLITREGDEYIAVELSCTHRGCGLQVRSDELHCPCHGSRFTPRGEVRQGPAQVPLKMINVTRQGDMLLLGKNDVLSIG